MISPRWRKVITDLGGNKTRTILVILSIAVGVFAAGYVSSGFLVLLNDMDADFNSVNPHAATIYASPFGDDELAAVKRMPGVETAAGRSSIVARVAGSQQEWTPIELNAIPPLDEMELDHLRPSLAAQEGELPPLKLHEVYIEQSGLSLLPVKAGDTIKVELPDKRQRTLRVVGIAHDVAGFPTVFSGRISAFVTPRTLEWLGDDGLYDQLYLTVSEDKLNEQHIRDVSERVAKKLEKGGVTTYATIIFTPGEHFASSLTRTLLAIMGALGGMSVLLSAFLVINTITALMAQHTRQIGIMKAVGGCNDQIVWMYVVLVTAFGLLSLAAAVPLAAVLAHVTSGLLANFLNYRPGPFRIPLESILMQAGVALAVPLAASLVPVFQGTRLTVREAISTYGLGADSFGNNKIDRLLERVQVLPRPFLISLRNTFRRKARLALTLFTLTLGGAIFIAVCNVQSAFTISIQDVLGYFLSDVNVSFNDLYRSEEVEQILYSVPGVKYAESWGITSARVLSDDKLTATEVTLFGPPPGSRMIEPVMTAGRWLVPNDENAVVVGNHFLKKRPDVKVGDELVLQIGGKEHRWKVVGIFSLAGNVQPPVIYANNAYLSRLTGQVGQAFSYRIATSPADAGTQQRVADELEKRFELAGMRVSEITTGSVEQEREATSINVLVYMLMIMAGLIALVGGIGLMGTMSMNVLERTREIGVMRSIGASDASVLGIVVAEGLVIGTISWLLGSLLAIPISRLLCDVVGTSFIQLPLPFVFSTRGILLWLGIVAVLSTIASLLPASNAVRLTVRDVLAYE